MREYRGRVPARRKLRDLSFAASRWWLYYDPYIAAPRDTGIGFIRWG